MKPSEFLEKIENESLRLSEEFSDDGYELTLWWGVDGLRMDDRGHYEWIKREVPKRKSGFGISTEEAIKAFTDLSNAAGERSYIGAEQVKSIVEQTYKYRGWIKYAEDLSYMEKNLFDVWHIKQTGKNMVWIGNEWVELSSGESQKCKPVSPELPTKTTR